MKRRFGTCSDGGYIVFENVNVDVDVDVDVAAEPWDLYITAGVGLEESFTWDFLSHYGYLLLKRVCWGFDGTISHYPKTYIPNGGVIWFVPKNIGPDLTPTTVNLHHLLEKYDSAFIKMDIEGEEFDWFMNLSPVHIGHIAQWVVELHDINDKHKHHFSMLWEKIQITHWVAHIHGNNFGGICHDAACRPNVIEVTFVRRTMNGTATPIPPIPENEIKIIPTPGLDYPNNPLLPDIVYCQPLRKQ
jgi:hypothetical protein